MNRKYDFLQEKETQQPYNFVHDSFQFNQDLEFVHNWQVNKKKSKTMHVTINQEEPVNVMRYKMMAARRSTHNKSMAQGTSQYQETQASIQRNNFIYNRTLDRFKEQMCSIRIKQGIQQIFLNAKAPKLISNLSSNKKISSYSEKDVSGMERRLKNRLKLAQKLKSMSKPKHSLSNLPMGAGKQSIRETLDRRIGEINKVVNQDAGSINLKIQEMDPINQMHRIRMIVEKGHRQLRLVGDEQHDNIEENIYEVRQLVRKYLKQ